MSLQSDSIFVAAIKDNKDLMKAISSRLYGTAIPVPDQDIINVPVPYVVVRYDGMQNDTSTKDSESYEGCEDIENVSLELAAVSREQLADLCAKTREVIRDYITANGEAGGIVDYALTADSVEWDQLKPCFWTILRYRIVSHINI